MTQDLDKDRVTHFFAELRGKAYRTVRHDRDIVSQTGQLDDVAGGRGGARQWSARGFSNMLILETCGLPIATAAESIAAIRALPLNPTAIYERADIDLSDFEFLQAKTFGAALDGLIRDHQRGLFDRFRRVEMNPNKPFPEHMRQCHVSIKFDETDGVPSASINVMHYQTMTAILMPFGPHHTREDEFWCTRTVVSTIKPNGPPSLLERAAALLGPIPATVAAGS
jgi:hypothetical protein